MVCLCSCGSSMVIDGKERKTIGLINIIIDNGGMKEIRYTGHSFMGYGGTPKGNYINTLDYPHTVKVIGNIYEKAKI